MSFKYDSDEFSLSATIAQLGRPLISKDLPCSTYLIGSNEIPGRLSFFTISPVQSRIDR